MAAEQVVTRARNASPLAITVVGVIFLAQVVLLALYLAAFGSHLAPVHLYPILWITVSAWVLWHARAVQSSLRRHLIAGAGAALYFIVLAFLAGMIAIGDPLTAEEIAFTGGIRIEASAPPGFAPAFFYVGSTLRIAIIPYLLIGYVTLSYLVYITILDTWAASAPGLLGIFGCISCSWPIVAALLGGATGPLAAAVYAYAYPLSTIAFLLAVGLLYWRPSYGTLRTLWNRS